LPIFASGAKHVVLLNPASDQLTGCREIKRVDTDNGITLSIANRTAARKYDTARHSATQRASQMEAMQVMVRYFIDELAKRLFQ
jgi:hypothetical protein